MTLRLAIPLTTGRPSSSGAEPVDRGFAHSQSMCNRYELSSCAIRSRHTSCLELLQPAFFAGALCPLVRCLSLARRCCHCHAAVAHSVLSTYFKTRQIRWLKDSTSFRSPSRGSRLRSERFGDPRIRTPLDRPGATISGMTMKGSQSTSLIRTYDQSFVTSGLALFNCVLFELARAVRLASQFFASWTQTQSRSRGHFGTRYRRDRARHRTSLQQLASNQRAPHLLACLRRRASRPRLGLGRRCGTSDACAVQPGEFVKRHKAARTS